jgi:hypothetical protein
LRSTENVQVGCQPYRFIERAIHFTVIIDGAPGRI